MKDREYFKRLASIGNLQSLQRSASGRTNADMDILAQQVLDGQRSVAMLRWSQISWHFSDFVLELVLEAFASQF
jgi:hypothetical protein